MMATEKKRPATADHANLPYEKWNATTVKYFLADETQRRFNVDYAPGGQGSKAQRYSAEAGMIKTALGKYGAQVIHRWLTECLDEYRPTPDYPYLTFGFALGYRDRGLARAQAEVAAEARRLELARKAEASRPSIDEMIDRL